MGLVSKKSWMMSKFDENKKVAAEVQLIVLLDVFSTFLLSSAICCCTDPMATWSLFVLHNKKVSCF